MSIVITQYTNIIYTSNHVTPRFVKKSVTNMGIKIYNNLLSEIKTTKNL
jgi:hypothetical protein